MAVYCDVGWSTVVHCGLLPLRVPNSGPEWSIVVHGVYSGPVWSTLVQYCLQWSRMVYNGPGWPMVVQDGMHVWPMIVQAWRRCCPSYSSPDSLHNPMSTPEAFNINLTGAVT